jgi:cytochrome P450
VKALAQSPREPAFVADPYPFYDAARSAGPLFHWEDYGFPCAAGHATVNAILRDRRFGREAPFPTERPAHLADFYAIDDLSMLEREPPAHTRLRGLVLRAFAARRVAALAPEIAMLAERLIDGFAAEPELDLLPSFAQRLPVIVIARLLGVPQARAGDLLGWSNAMVALYQARRDRAVEDRANRAARDFAAYLREVIADKRGAPGDDLLSALIAAEAEGDRLSEAELVATCVLLLNAGHEATVAAIGNAVAHLLSQDLDPRLLFDGERATAAAVDELLRYDPPLHLFTRYALEDVEMAGHAFRRGETVGLLLAAAGRDPARYPAPHRFDPVRGGEGHLAFGAGLHFCVGAPLARLELAVALPMLFARLPRLSLTEPPVWADRYHFRGLERLLVRPRG